MRVVFSLCFLFLASLFAKNLYSDKVISLYLNKDDSTAAGRLLPTNAFEVVKEDGAKVLLKVSGFVNPTTPSVLYFNDSQRIMVAAFGKSTTLDFKDKVAGKNGKWDKVSIEVWADKGEFSEDNAAILAKGKELFTNNCGICHALHPEKEFGSNQWPATFRSMADRTGIDKDYHWLVIEYLQKNSKDYKGETK